MGKGFLINVLEYICHKVRQGTAAEEYEATDSAHRPEHDQVSGSGCFSHSRLGPMRLLGSTPNVPYRLRGEKCHCGDMGSCE